MVGWENVLSSYNRCYGQQDPTLNMRSEFSKLSIEWDMNLGYGLV
jgi:hypothetical protein